MIIEPTGNKNNTPPVPNPAPGGGAPGQPPAEPKKAPNRLVVDEPRNDDNSIIAMNEAKLKELKIFNGDPVILKGKRRHQTLCIAVRDNNVPPEKCGINKIVRNNCRVKIGDIVNVKSAAQVPNLKKIHILPYADSIEGLTGNIA